MIRTMMISLILFLGIYSPTFGESLQETILVEIEESVLRQSSDNLLTFRENSIDRIFPRNAGDSDDYEYLTAVLDPLISDKLISLRENQQNVSLYTLELERCGAGHDLDIPQDVPLDGPESLSEDMYMPRIWAIIDQVRLANGFGKIGINFDYSLYAVGLLREEEVQHSSSSVIIKRPALKSLNNLLHERYSSGVYENLYQILDYSEGCGAGEIEVDIETDSSLSSVWVIPEFYFRVCNKRTSNPWNTDDCIFWDNLSSLNLFSGIYRWQGIENNENRVSGSFSVTDNDHGKTIRLP